MRRKVADAEVKEGKVIVKTKGLFGGDGVCNLTLRDEDIRRSAPFSHGDPNIAALTIKRQGWAYISSIQSKSKRELRLERKEVMRMGKDKGKLNVDFEDEVDVEVSYKALALLAKNGSWSGDHKTVDKKKLELLVGEELFRPGLKEDKTLVDRRMDFLDQVKKAYREVDDLELKVTKYEWAEK